MRTTTRCNNCAPGSLHCPPCLEVLGGEAERDLSNPSHAPVYALTPGPALAERSTSNAWGIRRSSRAR